MDAIQETTAARQVGYTGSMKRVILKAMVGVVRISVSAEFFDEDPESESRPSEYWGDDNKSTDLRSPFSPGISTNQYEFLRLSRENTRICIQ